MSRSGAALVQYLTSLSDTPSPVLVGTITGLVPAGAADGNALVTVNWQGAQVYATYLASYTPVIGHVVAMLRTQPLLILDRVVGTPPI